MESDTFKIVQLISGRHCSGAARHCAELIRQLADRGHEVLVVHKQGGWIADQGYPDRVQFLETTFRRTPAELRRVAESLHARQIDVIHSHHSSAHFFGVLLARLFRFRCVATTHMTFLQPHWWWNDRVIAPSQATARFQRRVNLVPSRRIDVIHNFIDPDHFRPQRTSSVMRDQLGLDESTFVITVIGSVIARKAPHVLVRSLPKIVAAGVNPHALFVGAIDKRYREQLDQEIQRAQVRDRVSLLGHRDDVADLLAATDCCCLSSNSEVMPISLLEAMSLGLPAVATRVGGVAESVRDGVDGYVVPPNRPDKLAEALIDIGRHPQRRNAMGQAAARHVRENFAAEVCVPQILATYARACQGIQRAA